MSTAAQRLTFPAAEWRDRDLPIAALNTIAFAIIVLLALLRVAATHDVFSHTVDEPAHIAAGVKFIEKGRTDGDLMHAPLARLAIAAGTHLAEGLGEPSCRIRNENELTQCDGERYWRTLTAARMATLPFFAITLTVAWLWATRIGGPLTGLLATALLSNTPSILAHAGLATTDSAATATLTLALFLLTLWLERPTVSRAVGFGCAAGLAVATKLSAIGFLPAASAAIIFMLTRDPRATPFSAASPPLRRHAIAAAMTAFLVAWSVYGFTLNPFPLAEAVRGIEAIAAMSGQPNYFMGEIPRTANWYFFPVMLAVKTPIPLLILIACGVAAALLRPSFDRRVLAVAAAAGAILAVGMLSRIDLGLRHVLAIYPLLALVAATGARTLFVRGVYLSAAAALLLSWLLLDVARAHPDYLAYFNEPARPHAAYFSADSDFDWGQDAERLAAALEERGIRRVSVAMQSTARLERLGLIEARPLWPGDRPTGWVAVSIGRILHDRVTRPYTGLRWLLCQRPVAQIGKTILLYNVRSVPRRRNDCRIANLQPE